MRRLCPALLLFLLALRCAPPRVQTQPLLPPDLKPAASFTPVPSIVNVPLELKTWYIENLLNRQVSDLLYECDTLTIGGRKPVKVKVWKRDSISIGLEGNELRYKVPLRVWMQFSFTVSAFGLSHTEYQDVEAGIALKFRSRISVKNDWKVSTVTESDGYEWVSDPVLRVRFLTIPIKPLADFIMVKQQLSFGRMVDSAVSTMLDVKKMLRPLWDRIQTPILLSQSPEVWLRLAPMGIYMTQLTGAGGVIKSSIGIKSVAETFFGSEPEAKKSDSFPEFVIPEHIDSTFIINLYSDLSYASASEILQSYLLGRTFIDGKKEVIVQAVNIYGLEGYAIISLAFTGSFRGKVYVIGHIAYDQATSTISIRDLEYDISTRNALHSAAGWLFHGIILSKIAPYLRFPIRERLLEAQLMIQKLISHREITKNLYINGIIDSLDIGGVALTDRSIVAVLLARGTLSMMAHD